MLERLDATGLKTTPCARAGPLQRPKGGWRPTLAMKWFQRAQILKSMRAFSVRRRNKLPDRNRKSEHHVAPVPYLPQWCSMPLKSALCWQDEQCLVLE